MSQNILSASFQQALGWNNGELEAFLAGHNNVPIFCRSITIDLLGIPDSGHNWDNAELEVELRFKDQFNQDVVVNFVVPGSVTGTYRFMYTYYFDQYYKLSPDITDDFIKLITPAFGSDPVGFWRIYNITLDLGDEIGDLSGPITPPPGGPVEPE